MKTIAYAILASCLITSWAAQSAAGAAAPEAIAKAFVDQLSTNAIAQAAAHFDTTMGSVMSERKLAETWQSLQTQAGKLQRQTAVRSVKYSVYDVVFVTCQFERTQLDVKVVINAAGEIAGLFFVPVGQPIISAGPPPYAITNAFVESAVTVGSRPWVLPGTLTLPRERSSPCPAIVLVHGSGPLDQDETVGPNKPFRDLAWGLASKGVGTLRYEKRTLHYAAKVAHDDQLTPDEEVIDDAAAAVRQLQSTEGVDPRRIFVLGHSLGAMLAPRIAQETKGLAGVILMAGPARPLEEVMEEQLRYIISVDTEPGKQEALKRGLANAQAESAKVKALTAAQIGSGTKLLGAPPSYWLYLNKYSPTQTARGLSVPMLILQGGRDYQVTMADFNLWKGALGDRLDVEFKDYPALNHLFISGTGRIKPDEYSKPGNVDEQVVRDIASFVSQPGH